MTRALTEGERAQLLAALRTLDDLRPAVVALAPDRIGSFDTAHEVLRALGTDTRPLLRVEPQERSCDFCGEFVAHDDEDRVEVDGLVFCCEKHAGKPR